MPPVISTAAVDVGRGARGVLPLPPASSAANAGRQGDKADRYGEQHGFFDTVFMQTSSRYKVMVISIRFFASSETEHGGGELRMTRRHSGAGWRHRTYFPMAARMGA